MPIEENGPPRTDTPWFIAALLTITGRLETFGRESRYAMWAYEFVILGAVGKANR